eukprot:g3536.t1
MDPQNTDSSQRDSFHYVDFRKNAVRGPDSHREYMKQTHRDVGRISWTRSPTRPSRDGRSINENRTKDDTDAFEDLLPMELKRVNPQNRTEQIANFSTTQRRVPGGRSLDIPGTTWSQPAATIKIPPAPQSSFAAPDLSATIQEQAWKEQVEIWFKEADMKDNGRIDGDEAVTFFSRTGLQDEDLSKMWRYAVPSGEHCMSKTHFINALKLVAVLQNDGRLTQDTVVRAVSEKYPCPGPKISPLIGAVSSSYQKPVYKEDEEDDDDDDDADQADSSSSSSESPQQKLRAFSMPVPSLNEWTETRIRPGMITQDISLDVASSAELSDGGYDDASGPSKACLVSVQLRLAPLRRKQSANLRIIIGVNTSLIAGPSLNGGVLQYFRVQDNPEAVNNGHFKKLDTEDADSAFCSEVNPSHMRSSGKVTCMLAHVSSRYLFLGYDDAYVEMHYIGKDPIVLTKCVNQWKAHKHGSIDAMAMTPWGDLWTGSSKGSIRIWSDLVAGKDPISRVIRRTGGEKPHGGVSAIVVSSCGSIVWTAGQNNIALWQACSGDYLGRIETDRTSDSSNPITSTERTLRINTSFGLDVDDSGRISTALSFGQRSMTFADDVDGDVSGSGLKVAVGKVAKIIGKGTKRIGKFSSKPTSNLPIGEDEPAPSFSPIRAVAAMLDRSMWVGYKNGLLERFTWNGRFRERRLFQFGLSCLCVVDDRMWIGLIDGTMVVYDIDFRELKQWSAHEATIIDITVLGPLVYSLAADGSIKGWSRLTPNQGIDGLAWQRFTSCLKEVVVAHEFKVLCGTWNVNQSRPSRDSLRSWLCNHNQHLEADIIVLGLQEVEGAGSVAKTMTYGKYGKSNSDKGSANANWWAEKFQQTLDCGDPRAVHERRWKRLGLRQMSGIIIYVFARTKLMSFIGNIRTAHVGTGVMGLGSNKGGVAITFSLYRRRVTVVAAHFAAHKHNVDRRNSDYRTMSRFLIFAKEKDVVGATSSSSPHAKSTPSSGNIISSSSMSSSSNPQGTRNQFGEVVRVDSSRSLEMESGVGGGEIQLSKGLQSAELVVWLGDFNYRVERTFSEAMTLIRNNKALQMLKWDQCRDQMKQNKVFIGLREGKIQFNPTYKFSKNINDVYGYDTEKERVPSWTDRIFFRGSKPFIGIEEEPGLTIEHQTPTLSFKANEQEPLISLDGDEFIDNRSTSFLDCESNEASSDHDVDEIVVHCESYNSCMDVVDSDHKPVWCLLNVNFPAFIQERQRRFSFEILREEMNRVSFNVGLQLSSKFIDFIGDDQKVVEVRNLSDCKVKVLTVPEEPENPNPHVPGWLDILPQMMILDPNQEEKIRFTTSQRGLGAKSSTSRIYKKLVVRAEPLLTGWQPIVREYELGVLLRAT